MQLLIDAHGGIRCIYAEAIDLRVLGFHSPGEPR
jgi:hypothetical protein